MARTDKVAAVAELSEQFSQSNGAVLTEYRGLTVAQLRELRRMLGEDVTYAVVKNTLTKLAVRDAGVEGLDSLLSGPSAIAFIAGDPVEAAKGLRDFAKANHELVIKGGVLDGRPVTPAEISQMADLESREVLLAKMAGAMQASLQNAASLFNAPLAQMARALGALQTQNFDEARPGGAPVGEAAAGETPAAPTAADETPADPTAIDETPATG
ncbi:50S ribosomal protein L10 [soil metagenome]